MVVESNQPRSVLDVPTEHLTPGMKQYFDVKKAHPDCLVMLRMGDFFEMFYEDAITAARELEITLTSRGKGDKKAPLAGVPYHALDAYLARLIRKGYKIALVEQLEDPKKAKGLVKRGVVRIITPGTVMESTLLRERENNYLATLSGQREEYNAAFCDLSTGEFFTSSYENSTVLFHDLARYAPSEVILPLSLMVNQELVGKLKSSGCFVNSLEDYYFSLEKSRRTLLDHFGVRTLDAFGLEERPHNSVVAGALLHYLLSTQKNSLLHLQSLSLHSNQFSMILDSATMRNLELLQNLRDRSTKNTLLDVLDKTSTVMGSRLLKQWLKKPLIRQELIQQRLDAVEELSGSTILRQEIGELLQGISDVERLIARVNYGNATPRDVLSLRNSLQILPALVQKIQNRRSSLLQQVAVMETMTELTSLLQQSIREEVPLTIREGGIIKEGYDPELEELRKIQHNSRRYLQELEEQERQKTGIASLKIGFTSVFGYFIEVTKKNISLVPASYIRQQTTANAERYITEELKKEEEKILGAEENSREREYALFQGILQKIMEKTVVLQNLARNLALLDVLCCLATVAAEYQYVKPELVEENVLRITQGRHPVVEQVEPNFVANDVDLHAGEMMIITGPNMAGKSTIMRQTALIVLMAQLGSFVPAEKAVLGIVDRIFTRVGAQDDLSSGQSTFMIEMSETAAILHNASKDSLIILDEIGRGTSTFDGVSIAWSVAEQIHNRVKARTMFATHYHVLNKLTERFPRVKNYNIAVREVRGEIIFLHQLLAGGTDQSYGIHVAKLAGLPVEVIERAREIQAILEKDDEMVRKMNAKRLQEQTSLEKF